MNDKVIAKYMALTTALLLIEAYYNRQDDNNFTMTIRPCEKCKAVWKEAD